MTSEKYVVSKNGEQLDGRYGVDQIAEMLKSEPGATFLVWQEGMPEWAEAGSLPGVIAIQRMPTPSGPPPAPDSSAPDARNTLKGMGRELKQLSFLPSLFDLSFSSMITPKLIRLFYVVAMILVAISAIGVLGSAVTTLFSGFRYHSPMMIVMGIGGFLLVPIVFIVGVAVCRLYAELVIVIFKIKENLDIIVEKD